MGLTSVRDPGNDDVRTIDPPEPSCRGRVSTSCSAHNRYFGAVNERALYAEGTRSSATIAFSVPAGPTSSVA